MDPSHSPPLVGRGNIGMKHCNKYNILDYWSTKIALRMHQNAPFSTQKSKILRPSWCGKGETPTHTSSFGASILTYSAPPEPLAEY